jgi:tetratricopeptide (TPR) repeat protein
MQRGSKFGAFLAAILLLCIGRNANAQTDDIAEQEITIICSAEQGVVDVLTSGSYGGAFIRDEEMLGNCYAIILNHVVSELQEHGFTISVVQDSPGLEPQIIAASRMEMYTTLNAHGAPMVSYRHFDTPQHLALSPILDAHMNSDIGLYVLSDEEKIAAANLATGIILYSLGHCDLAIPYFNEVEVAEFQTDEGQLLYTPDIYFYHGNCALLGGDYQTAIDYYESAFSEDFDLYNTFVEFSLQTNLAWTYLQLGESEIAFELMHILVETHRGQAYTPRFEIEALVRRAQLYILAFRYDDAIADMDAAINLDPDNPELYVLRANITLLIYEWDRVLADYNTAIELAPDYADAYFYRGVFYYTRTEYDLALADLNHYLELTPDGIHAADTTTYIEEIERTQAALDG